MLELYESTPLLGSVEQFCGLFLYLRSYIVSVLHTTPRSLRVQTVVSREGQFCRQGDEQGNRELGTCPTPVLLDVPLNQDS